jgi:GR25 family glycosyltransferase involved in LPS biosynthesis
MTAVPENPWAFFDRLYCISLRDRTDRRERARIEFSRMGIEKRVAFVLVDKDHTDPCRGIFASHMQCMEKAIDAGAQRWVVFEDDVVFRRYHPKTLTAAVNYLSTHSNWTLLFLGCLITGSSKTDTPGIKKIRYQALAHAYAVNRAFGEKILKQSWRGIPYDTMLKTLGDSYLGTTPFFAFQSNAATDNDACLGLDRVRRCFGGLGFIQRATEFFHAHRLLVIFGHLVLLSILAVCIW